MEIKIVITPVKGNERGFSYTIEYYNREVTVDGELYYKDTLSELLYSKDKTILKELENWLFAKEQAQRGGDVARYPRYNTGFFGKIRLHSLKLKYKLLYVFSK